MATDLGVGKLYFGGTEVRYLNFGGTSVYNGYWGEYPSMESGNTKTHFFGRYGSTNMSSYFEISFAGPDDQDSLRVTVRRKATGSFTNLRFAMNGWWGNSTGASENFNVDFQTLSIGTSVGSTASFYYDCSTDAALNESEIITIISASNYVDYCADTYYSE